LSITSIAGSAQQMIISALYLDGIEWLKPAWRIGLAISIFANYLLFSGFSGGSRATASPQGADSRHLIAAVGFEIIKIIMTWTLPALVNPLRAAFGSVLGIMAFFYFLPA
jgi:membrane protein